MLKLCQILMTELMTMLERSTTVFSELPESIQNIIKQHLEDNNFPAAKQIYEEWKASQSVPANRQIIRNVAEESSSH